jgi:hypothetical protein
VASVEHPKGEIAVSRRLKLRKLRTAHASPAAPATTMNTVFLPPGPPTDLSGKHMNSVSPSVPAHVIAPGAAANADHLGERSAVPAAGRAEPHGGWDAYEVWRRFIKEARDARDRSQHHRE